MPRANADTVCLCAVMVAGTLGCAGESPATRRAEAPPPPAAQTVVADTMLAAAGDADPRAGDSAAAAPVMPPRTDATPQGPPPSPLVGAWHLLPAAPIRPGSRGIRLALAIDSVRSSRLYGRLAHYVAGNVELDPAAYAPFVGELSGDRVALRLQHRDPAGPALAFAGRVAGDTIHLTTVALGLDTLSRGTDWLLLKER